MKYHSKKLVAYGLKSYAYYKQNKQAESLATLELAIKYENTANIQLVWVLLTILQVNT